MLRTKTRNSFKLAALLLTGVLFCAPTFAGGDETPAAADKGGIDLTNPDLDADPLPADDVAAAQRSVETKVVTEVSTNGDMPAEVRVEVRVKLNSLNREYEEIKRRQKELEELRERDREEFDRRLAALEAGQDPDAPADEAPPETGGLAGAVEEEVVDVIEEGPPPSTGDGATDAEPGTTDEEVVAGSSDASSDPNAATLPPATDPDAGLPGTEPEKKPTWWQKLLKAVAKEAGKALGKWVRGQLEKLRDKADAYASDTAAGNPKWKTAIARLFSDGVDDILSGKYNSQISGAINSVANKLGGGSSDNAGAGVPAPPALPAADAAAPSDASIPAVDPAVLPPLPPSPTADRTATGDAVVNNALGQ